MKFFKLIALVSAATFGFYALGNKTDGAAKPAEKKSAFIIVNDDSGVLTAPERAKAEKLMLLAQLKALNGRKQYVNTELQLISTSYARPVWVGKISDLRTSRAADLVAKIEAQPDQCNKLAESFTAVKTAIRQLEQQRHNDIRIYFMSSLISTPSPCKDVTVTLPQVPVPVNFQEVLASSDAVTSIAFYYVNPHQVRLYQEVLKPIISWTNTSGKAYGMWDMEATSHQLRSGLLGVK